MAFESKNALVPHLPYSLQLPIKVDDNIVPSADPGRDIGTQGQQTSVATCCLRLPSVTTG